MPTPHLVTTAQEIDAVVALAHEIWNEHFTPIIGQAQVDYMLDKFQSSSAITRQMREDGLEYYLVLDEHEHVGYFALVHDAEASAAQLSKFYLKRARRGRGLGRAVFTFIENECAIRGVRELWLTVNRHNAGSIGIYRRLGFDIVEPIVTDIGSGFAMDDYRMVKRVDLDISHS